LKAFHHRDNNAPIAAFLPLGAFYLEKGLIKIFVAFNVLITQKINEI
jgi:hypothetical protein